jgi:hypothetical protein
LTVRKLLKNILQDFFIALRQHQNVLSNWVGRVETWLFMGRCLER